MSVTKKHVAILGSTGSIGTQALSVIDHQRDHFVVEVLTANHNDVLLVEQAIKFKPKKVVICDESRYARVAEQLSHTETEVLAGYEALDEVVTLDAIDVVLTAMVGFAGLRSTVSSVKSGKNIALANKETLVVAGDLITSLAKSNGVVIMPVDSEHSAIAQCLVGEEGNEIEKIYLTASGGPFRGSTIEELKMARPEQALKHPNWDMGSKITIDSATLMNKGLEVIEAKWLFNLEPAQIEVIVHPQSIIHSIVQFSDGSMKAQMGLPDMRLPIQYALAYPERILSDFPRFDFKDYHELTFEAPDTETFRCLQLAFNALNKGGNSACVLNAANEMAVSAFLNHQIRFDLIPDVIEQTMDNMRFIHSPGLEEYEMTDDQSRKFAASIIDSVKESSS